MAQETDTPVEVHGTQRIILLFSFVPSGEEHDKTSAIWTYLLARCFDDLKHSGQGSPPDGPALTRLIRAAIRSLVARVPQARAALRADPEG